MSGDPFLDALKPSAGIAQGSAAPASQPSAELHNPGNLKPGFNRDGTPRMVYPGQTGVDRRGIATFADDDSGRQAGISQLQRYQQKQGRPLSFSEIAHIYAPRGDGANNPDAYAAATAGAFGKKPTDTIDLSNPANASALFDAHVAVEQGHKMAPQVDVNDAPPMAQADPNDPFLQQLNSAIGKGDGNLSALGPGDPGLSGAGDSGNDPSLRVDGVQGSSGQGLPDGRGSSSQGLSDYIPSPADIGAGIVKGAGDVAITATKGLNWLSEKSGLDRILPNNNPDDWEQRFDKTTDAMANDPNSWGTAGGRLVGNILATAPLAEMRLFSAAREGAPLARGLARYLDMAAQGGTAGALSSRGENVGEHALTGAILAPVIGRTIEAVAPPVANAFAGAKNSSLARGLTRYLSRDPGDAAAAADAAATRADLPPMPAGQSIRTGAQMADADAQAALLAKYGGDQFNPGYASEYKAQFGEAPPLEVKVEGGQPLADDIRKAVGPSAEDFAKAAGSRAEASGIEGDANYPAPVLDRARQLAREGAPHDEAIRQAEMEHIGANPTVATVTRNFGDQQVENEASKLATDQGAMLRARQDENNAALHARAQQLIADYGGKSENGAATEGAASALAKASDAEYGRVNDAYTAARQQTGDATIDAAPLQAALNTLAFKGASTTQAQSLRRGFRAALNEISANGTKPINADELEALRQIANGAYDPSGQGGNVNTLIKNLKDTIDGLQDEIGKTNDAYANARAQYKAWADKYENPDGIRRLIQRDAQGNFVNGDQWRRAETSFIGSTSDRQFVQVVKQLKANESDDALNALKARVIQRAYDKASSAAINSEGHSLFSGKEFFRELNSIGKPKLNALFYKSEQSELRTLGSAAQHLNEPVPKSYNMSGTTAAAINAIRRAQQGAESGQTKLSLAKAVAAAGIGTALKEPGIGSIMAVREAAKPIGEALARRGAARQAANDVGSHLDMSAYRARLAQEIAKQTRAAKAREVARTSAPIAGAAQDRKR